MGGSFARMWTPIAPGPERLCERHPLDFHREGRHRLFAFYALGFAEGAPQAAASASRSESRGQGLGERFVSHDYHVRCQQAIEVEQT
jgi:hypothetical protein